MSLCLRPARITGILYLEQHGMSIKSWVDTSYIPCVRTVTLTMPPKVNVHPSIRDKGRYRIQSVETEQFVERKGAGLVLYPLKKTSENQEVSILTSLYLVSRLTQIHDSGFSWRSRIMPTKSNPSETTVIASSWPITVIHRLHSLVSNRGQYRALHLVQVGNSTPHLRTMTICSSYLFTFSMNSPS